MKEKSFTIPYNFTPRPDQLKFIQEMDEKRFGVIRAHRRWGKDKVSFNYLARQALARVGLYLYLFKDGSDAERAVWDNTDNDGFPLLEHFNPELLKHCKVNNNKMKITFPNGSVFRCIGGADSDKLRGANAVGVVFSEYAFCDPSAWTSSIQPMIMANGGWVIFNSTPNSPGDHFEKICQHAKNNRDKWAYCEWQTYDETWPHYSGMISEEQLEFMRANTPEDELIREYGCSIAGAVQGSYYTQDIELARKEGRIGHYPYNDNLPVDVFFDIGRSDDTVMWFRQVDGGRIIWIDYHANSQQSVAPYVRVLQDKGYRYRNLVLPWDGAHGNWQTSMDNSEVLDALCAKAGIYANVHVCSKSPIQDGINAVRSRFRRYFFDMTNCEDGLMHLEAYKRKYNNSTRSFSDKPLHDASSHAADAIRTEAAYEELDARGGTMNGYDAIQLIDFTTDYDLFE